jgi:hypothetical protein
LDWGQLDGAPTIAVDVGAAAVADHLCYVGSVWEGELRLTAKTKGFEDKPVFKAKLGEEPKFQKASDGLKPPVLEGFDGGERIFVLGGIAARDGLLVGSLVRQNELCSSMPKRASSADVRRWRIHAASRSIRRAVCSC